MMETQMGNFWRTVLHLSSVTGMFLFFFGLLSLMQMYTIGIIFNLNHIKLSGFPIFPVIYGFLSVIIIKKYFKFTSNYSN